MSKRTQGKLRLTVEVSYDVGTQGEEAERLGVGCGTTLLRLHEDGLYEQPITQETIKNCAATLFDVLVKENVMKDALVRITEVELVKGS